MQQKLREWKQRDSSTLLGLGDAEALGPEQVSSLVQASSERPSNDDDVLCLRLATANARRRAQLRYWDHHPFVGRERSRSPGEESLLEMSQSETRSLPGASEGRSRKSNPTVHSFSTVAKSAIFESKTPSGPARTVLLESVAVDDNVLKRIPRVPGESGGIPFVRVSLIAICLSSQHACRTEIHGSKNSNHVSISGEPAC